MKQAVSIFGLLLLALLPSAYFLWTGDLCIPTRENNSCYVQWNALGSIVAGLAIGGTAIVAFWGLNTWKHEQRAELAMEMLTLAHEGVAQLRTSLSPQPITDSIDASNLDYNNRASIRNYLRERNFRSARYFRQNELATVKFWARLEATASKVRAIFTEFDAYPLEKLMQIRNELLDLAFLLKAYEEHLARRSGEEFSICGSDHDDDALDRATELFPCELRSDVFVRNYIGETEVSGGSFSESYNQLKYDLESVVTLARSMAFRIFGKKWIPEENRYQGPG